MWEPTLTCITLLPPPRGASELVRTKNKKANKNQFLSMGRCGDTSRELLCKARRLQGAATGATPAASRHDRNPRSLLWVGGARSRYPSERLTALAPSAGWTASRGPCSRVHAHSIDLATLLIGVDFQVSLEAALDRYCCIAYYHLLSLVIQENSSEAHTAAPVPTGAPQAGSPPYSSWGVAHCP